MWAALWVPSLSAMLRTWSMEAQLRQDRQRDVLEARDALLDGLVLPRLALLHAAVETVRRPGRRTADGEVPSESFEDALWRTDVRAEVNSLLSAADRVGRPQAAFERVVASVSALAIQLVVLTVTMPVAFSQAVTNAGIPVEVTAAAGGMTALMAFTASVTFARLTRARRRLEQLIGEAREV